MKKRILSTLSLATLACIALTGCNLLPTAPNTPNASSTPTQSDNIVTSVPDNDVVEDDIINRLVNNTLNEIEHRLYQPLTFVNTNYSQIYETKGSGQNYQKITDGYGNIKTENPIGSRFEDVTRLADSYQFKGNVDNVYNHAIAYKRPTNNRDKSNYTILASSNLTSSSSNSSNEYTSSYYHENEQTYYQYGTNESHMIDNEMFTKQFALIYNSIYQFSTTKYDFDLTSINLISTIINLTQGGRDNSSSAVIDLIAKLASFINKEMPADDFLTYFYTMVLNEDIKRLDDNTKQILLTALATIQSVDISNIFTVNQEQNNIVANFDYSVLLNTATFIKDTLKQVIDLLSQYQDVMTFKRFLNDFELALSHAPKDLILTRTFIENKGIITSYNIIFNVDGEVLTTQRVNKTSSYDENSGLLNEEYAQIDINNIYFKNELNLNFYNAPISITRP